MSHHQKKFFANIFLFFTLFSIFFEQKTIATETSIENSIQNKTSNQCSYYLFLSELISKKNNDYNNLNSEDLFFSSIENHRFNLNNNMLYSKIPQCNSKCNNLNLNKIYESLLAKHIMENKNLNKKTSYIFINIFTSMKNIMGEFNFYKSINNWANSKKSYELYDKSKYEFSSTNQSNLFSIGLAVDIHGQRNSEINPAFQQLDYLLYNAKEKDKVGFIESIKIFPLERDYFFDAIIRRVRGYRGNKIPKNKTFYYGISYYDIPQLKTTVKREPWRNWARDSCKNESRSNLYTNSIYQLQIPLACGISGTTNLVLWSMMAYGRDLDENNVRLLLLETWARLSVNTGHSLQEVLTMAKLASVYFRELIETPNPNQEYFKTKFSLKTLESLEKVTESIKALSDSDESINIKNWEETLYRIYNHKFTDSNEVDSYYKPIVSKNEKKSTEQEPEEKEKRKELELYFSYYDSQKAEKSHFGTYYDSFLSKINDDDYTYARKQAQNDLKTYFSEDCLPHN